MNKTYALIGTILFAVNVQVLSMADMGRAFRFLVEALQPSCFVTKDIESHGCICKKRIEHVSRFINDGYEYYCTQLSSDDWLVACKKITGISQGAIVCLRYLKRVEGIDWISLPIDQHIFFMLQERYEAISLMRTYVC